VFIGHYGAALAAKRVSSRLSLGALFLAVQLLDVLFASFVLAGVEKLRIVPGMTAYNPYDLYFMPYTHSFTGSLLWSAVFAGGTWLALLRWRARERAIAAMIFGAAVLSHFVLDVPMHTPDMPIGFSADSPKIGLGLWNHVALALALEIVTLSAGALVYLRALRSRSPGGRAGTMVFGVVLLALTLSTPFMPAPASDRMFAVQSLAAYFALALAAHFVDGGRKVAEGG
jgi:hypothetical protein